MIDLAPRDRPREKLERSGASTLGDNELVAVILGHGTPGTGVRVAAEGILAAAGGIHGLVRLPIDRLARLAGVGRAQACRLAAAVELGRRTLLTAEPKRRQFLSPAEVGRYLLPQFGGHPVERFGVMLLDTRQRLLQTRLISVGSIDASLAHPREVFREALVAGAAAVVVFHNHPSGDPAPSREDIALTRRLGDAGVLVGVSLVDHVILGDTLYCSMKESGYL